MNLFGCISALPQLKAKGATFVHLFLRVKLLFFCFFSLCSNECVSRLFSSLQRQKYFRTCLRKTIQQVNEFIFATFPQGLEVAEGKIFLSFLVFLICHVIKFICHQDTTAVWGWQIWLWNSRLKGFKWDFSPYLGSFEWFVYYWAGKLEIADVST